MPVGVREVETSGVRGHPAGELKEVRVKRADIAAQLWTVRSLLGDVRGLAAALGEIRKIGYRAVQLASLGPIPPQEVRRVLEDTAVQACSAHEAAGRAGCRWYIVEQDDHWRSRDPITPLRESWRFLSRLSEDAHSRDSAAGGRRR